MAIMQTKRLIIITFLFLLSFSMETTVLAILYGPLFLSDISWLFQKVYAQKWVFITPGASVSNNSDAFVPPVDVVSSGSIVTWTNEDSTTHTVTADKATKGKFDQQPIFDSGPISPSCKFENAFDSVGVFGYHCSIHPFMRGSIIAN